MARIINGSLGAKLAYISLWLEMFYHSKFPLLLNNSIKLARNLNPCTETNLLAVDATNCWFHNINKNDLALSYISMYKYSSAWWW